MVRWNWMVLILVLTMVPDQRNASAAPGQEELPETDKGESIKALRRKAADRRRRLIINDDGSDPVMQMTRPSAQDFLDKVTIGLIDSEVDTISYCPRCSGFGMFTYFTKVGQVFTTTEGRYSNNQMEALLREGIDPLQIMVNFCKQNRKEIFCSFRMNDNHDGTKADYAPLIFRANKFKNEHPELLLGTIDSRPKIGAWAAVDYGRPKIRELAFRFAEEVCKNYDLDGVELDFFRHPVLFKSNANGLPATDADRTAMTELLLRIRAMADAEGQKRGRPILISVRAPDSVDYARAIGLDLEKWMADDLVDLYMAAGTFQLNEWKYSVALAHKYKVKVYPSLDDTRVVEPSAKQRRMTNLAYRGRAAEAWSAGADGILLFNFPRDLRTESKLLEELGDPKKLAKLDKDYFGSVRGVKNSSGGNLPIQPFQKIETLTADSPRAMVPGKSITAKLHLPEGFPENSTSTSTLQLIFEPLPKSLEITLNGRAAKDFQTQEGRLKYKVPPGALRGGDNEIKATISAEDSETTNWTELFLEVRRHQDELK